MIDTLDALLARLRSLDVRLWAEQGALRYSAPPGVLSAELLDELKERKAEILALLDRAGTGGSASPIVPVPRDGPLPLSFAQERLWFLDQLEGQTSQYNMPIGLRLDGPLDREALAQALAELARRHEVLRTTFATRGGVPVQRIAPGLDLAPSVVDLSALPADERAGTLTGRTADEAARPFDLAAGPLVRVALFRLEREAHVLLLTLHHIVTDGWSLGILMRELATLYGGFAGGAPSPMPPPALQYADFAVWQRAWLTEERLAAQLAYWTRQLAGAPDLLGLPADRPRPTAQTFRGGTVPFSIPAELARRLRDLGRRSGTTSFMTLLAGLQALLRRYTGEDDIVVGTDVANRTRAETEPLLGFFVNQLALRTDLSGDPTFGELLARVRDVCLGAYGHQDLPFQRLLDALRLERDLSRTPLFQVKLVLQTAPDLALDFGGLAVSHFAVPGDTTTFDLVVVATEGPAGIDGAVTYRTELFDEATIRGLLDHWRTLLADATARPERRLSELELLTDSERDELAAGGHVVPDPHAIRRPDRHAPRAAAGEPDRAALGEAPRDQNEAPLAELWASLLAVERVDRHASFFEVGGHSLLAVQLVARIRDVFGVELPVRRVFEAPTVAGLAREITEARGAGPVAVPALLPLAPDEPRQLSFAQTRLSFINRLEPESGAYNIPLAYRLHGPLDVALLERGLAEVVRRHAVLRTRFVDVDGVAVTHVASETEVRLSIVDLSGAEPDEVARLIGAEAARPFDLARESPLRVTLAVLGPAEHALLITLHHIAADAWSHGLLLDELSALYEAGGSRGPATLPALALQYDDYAAWQRRWLTGDTLAAHVAYWKAQLADVPPLSLPLDFPRPARRSYEGAARPFELSREVTAGFDALCRGAQVTPFMALLAAFAALLSRHGAGRDIAIGSPVANRGHRETEKLIGLFVNTLVLRVDLAGDPTVGELLARVRHTALDAYAHADLPFEKLVEELSPARDPGRNPLFQVSFTLQPSGALAPRFSLGDVRAEPIAPDRLTIRFDLELHMWADDGRLRGALVYGTDLFRADTVEGLVRHFETLLSAMAVGTERRLASLPIMDDAERSAMLTRGARRAAYPAACLHERFADQAAARPDAIAVVDGAAADAAPPLTYRELDERSNQVAHRLRALGVGAESRVAILVERSPAMIVGIVGILKAGGAYVPIDPASPAERVAALLADARPHALVTEEGRRDRLPAEPGAPVVSLDGDAPALAAGSCERCESGATPGSLAYVIYTSGSTGKPKGVMVTHANVTRLFASTADRFDFGHESVWSLFHSYAFDFSVWELWGALLHGGRVVVVPYWVSRSPAEFHELLRREGVTVLSQTPSAFRQLIGADAAAPDGGLRLRDVVFGGEALDFRMLRSWVERHGDERPRLVNMYGITETTVHVTYRRVMRADVSEARSLVGAPLPDLELYVLDERGAPTPEGVTGELYVGGAGVARGYLERDALTRERFVAHPFRAGERLYRSGDTARWVAGDLEYLGRVDQQVQLRGFRVEPGEIEVTLREHGAVRDAVVLYRDDGPRGARLIAFAVVADDASLDGIALRRWLALKLPDHMVPATVVRLDALPLTSNGKLDRAALLAVDDATGQDRVHVATAPEGPSDPESEVLAGLWRDLLGVELVGPRTDFFEVGGHSLVAARLVSRIRSIFGVELPLREVFERPTVVGLAEAVRRARHDGAAAPLPPIMGRPSPPDGVHPLSFSQERIWFLDQLDGGSPTFNVLLAARLEGALDPGALERSLAAVVERHDVLRLRVVMRDDRPGQIVTDAPFALTRLDLTGDADGDGAERAAMRRDATRAFDLTREPPIRATLLTRGPADHVLLLSLHHIATDGWSLPILLREWAALYAADVAGQAPALAAPTIQYTDFAAWQREQVAAGAFAGQLDYWKARLADLPPELAMPTDRARPDVSGPGGRTLGFTLDAQLTRALKSVAAGAGATLFMTLCAAYAAWLARQTGDRDLCIGTPLANRTRAEIEPLVGCFVNTLVLRVDASGDPSFHELIARVRTRALEAYDHQDLPFEQLVEALAPERRLSQTPLIQTMFDLAPPAVTSLDLPGLRVSAVPHGHETAKFDLSLSMSESPAGLHGVWEYRTELFDDATARDWTSHFTTLLIAMVAAPERPIAALPLMSDAEARRLLDAGRGPAADAHAPVRDRFAAWARRTPDAVALVSADGQVTYGALHTRVSALARGLRSRQGVGPEAVVGVLLDRCPDLIASFLAVLAAGGAYLPLDPALPDDRLGVMLAASGARTVLTHRRHAGRLRDSGVDVVALDDGGRRVEDTTALEAPVAVAAENLAYVMFTSGSTGMPKGVMITAAGLAGLTHAAISAYAIDASDRVLQFASPSFDMSVEEIYPCLASGATLVLKSETMSHSIPALLRECDALAVSVANLPTAYWHELVAELAPGGGALPASLRQVMIGGGRARPDVLATWERTVGGVPRLLNAYGPTEATVDASVSELSRPGLGALAEVPIGRPIVGSETYVLDAGGGLAATGVPGELVIGGGGVARGYIGEPALTAASFIPGAHASRPGARLYRSGDRARWLADGELQYLGRLDTQTKIRGYRVEPGEIEAVLRRQAGVREAAIVARGDATGETQLAAYVVPAGESAAGTLGELLREACRAALPAYMVPAAIVLLERLPLTSAGKLDERALPAPDRGAALGVTTYSAPRTADEQTLALLWADLLSLDKVGVDDNFFDLGGHSLALLALQRRIRRQLGRDVTVVDLFRFTTVRALARHLAAGVADDAPAVLAVQERGARQREALRGFQRRGRGGAA